MGETRSRAGGNGMKNVCAAAVTIVLVAFLTGCSTQATQQNENFDTELKALSLENHNLDQSFAARPDGVGSCAVVAAATVHDLDEEIPAYQNIFEREHALCAKYNKELASETVAYEAAKLRYFRASREFFSYLATTDCNHGANANPSEYERVKKVRREAFAEEQRDSKSLRK